jgi:hypothetical protein
MYRASGDIAVRDKAVRFFSEWSRTVKANGDCRADHYAFDKMVCGLVDLQRYAGHQEAAPVLARITAFADRTFARPAEQLADITDNPAYYRRLFRPGDGLLGHGRPELSLDRHARLRLPAAESVLRNRWLRPE